MTLWIFLALATFLTCFIMPWINHSRLNRLRSDLSALKTEFRSLQQGEAIPPGKGEHKDTEPVPAPTIASRLYYDEPSQTDPVRNVIEQHRHEPVIAAAHDDDESPRKNNFELNIGTKLPVWVGAISLICAAFFLIKYSVEAGWFGPMARDLIGGAFGVALVASAQWAVKRPALANHLRIAQGLAGAGIVTLYFCLYAAVNLHDFLSPLAGFAGMAAVTGLAVILSLRHGQTIALFGLVGGLLTPLLMETGDTNAVALFGYLFVLFAGVMSIVVRQRWWGIAGLTLAGMFAWIVLWFGTTFDEEDSLAALLFVAAICGCVLAATRNAVANTGEDANPAMPEHALNIGAIAGGAATIALFSVKMRLSLFDWSMLELLSLGCAALAWFRPGIYMMPLLVKAGADLLLLALLAPAMQAGEAFAVVAAMALVHVGLPAMLSRRVHDPRGWAVLQTAAAAGLYLIAYSRIDLPGDGFPAGLWGGIALILAALTVRQAAFVRAHYQADAKIQDQLTGLYAFVATAFISFGFAIELPMPWLPLAFASQIAATIWIGQRTDVGFMRMIAGLLCLVFIGLNYEQFQLFVEVALSSITERLVIFLDPGITAHPLTRLVLPVMMTGLALVLHRRDEPEQDGLSHLLFGVTLTLALDAAYLLIRALFHHMGDAPAGFIERGVITIGIACCAAALLRLVDSRTDGKFLMPWGYGLMYLAMLRIVWFDLLVHNPYFDAKQFVGALPVLNGVTMTYGAGLVLALWSARRQGPPARALHQAFGFTMLFALISLNIRQVFHGGVLAQGGMADGEFYAYSIAWMVTGLALLGAGIVRHDKTMRVASLVFIVLTVGKVFLLDTSELEGLYRVFSFLGLGVSLIGLSAFYSRFILRSGQAAEDTGGS